MYESVKNLSKRLLRSLGLSLERRDMLAEYVPNDYLHSKVLPPVYRQSVARLLYFHSMLNSVRDVDGDIVECGVSIGHGLLYFTLLSELLGRERDVHGFDSFAGFPQSTDPDRKSSGDFEMMKGDYASPKELVTRVLHEGRVSQCTIDERVRLYRGYFEETLPSYRGAIALLHLDCDLYESYQTCLGLLYDKVVDGGVIMFDEYEDPNFPGAKRAIDEFFDAKREQVQSYRDYGYRKSYIVKLASDKE